MVSVTRGQSAVDGHSIKLNSAGALEVSQDVLSSIYENEIELIELQANATVTPFTHDYLFSETFSDADGYGDSVTTVAPEVSQAEFDTNKYKRQEDDLATISDYETYSNLGANSNHRGFSFTMKQNATIKSVTKHPSCTATVGYIKADDGTTLSSASFVGNVATFGSPVALTNGTKYRVTADNSGSSYTLYGWTFSTQREFAKFTMNNGSGATGDGSQGGAIEKVTFTSSTETRSIEIAIPTIPVTVTGTQLVVNAPERETGDNITYELEDGSGNIDTSQAIETYNALSNLTGNPEILRINLVPKSSSATNGYPSVKTFALKFFTE